MQFVKENAANAAGQRLARRSVQFTEDLRYDDVKAYPFHYSFMTANIIEANNGVEPIGWSVPAGSITDIPIILDRDKIWHLLNIKYTAMELISGNSYRWWDNDVYPYETNFGADLTGTIAIAAASVNIVGTGTDFDPEIDVGDIIVANDSLGLYKYFQIATRTNDTTATATVAATNAVSGATFKKAGVAAPSGGTITLTAGSTAVVGVGTTFTVDITAGDFIGVVDASGNLQAVQVASITDNTNLVLAAPPTVSVAGSAYAIMNYSTWAQPFIPGTQTTLGRVPRLRWLTDYLRVTLFFPALDDIYSYGIPQRLLGAVPINGLVERRVMVHALQGANSGLGMLRTPMQLPHEGHLVVRVQNIHNTKDLFVNGSLFGYKVRAN